MLVITRKNGESFQIGNDITVRVIKVGVNTVKIAIDAPKEYNIVRSELIEIHDENMEAANHNAFDKTNMVNLMNSLKGKN